MTPHRLTASMRCQFSSGPKLLLSGPMPALFIRMSVPPNRFCTAASSPATSSKRLTSTAAVMTSAAPPLATDASVAAASASRSAPISAMQTFMPRPAKRVAAASPMPEAPPVMTATLFGDMAGWGKVTLRIDQDPRTLQACSPHAIVLMRVRNSDGKARRREESGLLGDFADGCRIPRAARGRRWRTRHPTMPGARRGRSAA